MYRILHSKGYDVFISSTNQCLQFVKFACNGPFPILLFFHSLYSYTASLTKISSETCQSHFQMSRSILTLESPACQFHFLGGNQERQTYCVAIDAGRCYCTCKEYLHMYASSSVERLWIFCGFSFNYSSKMLAIKVVLFRTIKASVLCFLCPALLNSVRTCLTFSRLVDCTFKPSCIIHSVM